MKLYLAILVVLHALVSNCSGQKFKSELAEVTGVFDGHTIEVKLKA